MKNILSGAMGMLGVFIVAAVAVLQFGGLDFAADQPHGPFVLRLVEWARERSIARRAGDLAVPADLADAGRIRRGAGNYDAMCVNCHLAPGVADSEIRRGLYPVPPELARPAGEAASATVSPDARRFWIIKHGIKASGMPAWSKGGMEDAAIWDLAAFLRVLPTLSDGDYRRQVDASDGHSHAGMAESRDLPATSPVGHSHEKKPHVHKPGAHAH